MGNGSPLVMKKINAHNRLYNNFNCHIHLKVIFMITHINYNLD